MKLKNVVNFKNAVAAFSLSRHLETAARSPTREKEKWATGTLTNYAKINNKREWVSIINVCCSTVGCSILVLKYRLNSKYALI